MNKMWAKIWNGYETVMAYIIYYASLLKKAFVMFFPVGGAITGLFLIIAFAGHCDYGSISEFLMNIFKTVLAYVFLMLLRFYIKSKED